MTAEDRAREEAWAAQKAAGIAKLRVAQRATRMLNTMTLEQRRRELRTMNPKDREALQAELQKQFDARRGK